MICLTGFVICLCLAVSSRANFNRHSSGLPTAKARNGTYQGVHSPEYDQDFFLGIPYAQPPVGDLRFKTPAPLTNTWNDLREATQYSGEVCNQVILNERRRLMDSSSVTDTRPINGTMRSQKTVCISMSFALLALKDRNFLSRSGYMAVAFPQVVELISDTMPPSWYRTLYS